MKQFDLHDDVAVTTPGRLLRMLDIGLRRSTWLRQRAGIEDPHDTLRLHLFLQSLA